MKNSYLIALLVISLVLAACQPAPPEVTPTTAVQEVTEAPTEIATEAPTEAPPAASPTVAETPAATETAALPETGATGTPAATLTPGPGAIALNEALTPLLQLNELITDPDLDLTDPTDIATVVQQGLEQGGEALAAIQEASDQVSPEAQELVQMAQNELNSVTQLGQLILSEPNDEQVGLRFAELAVHASAALGALNQAATMVGVGPSAPGGGHVLVETDLQVPDGYQAEIVANGLNFASAIAVASDGAIYVAEAGYSYGNIQAPARVLRIGEDGSTEVVAEGFEGPIAGLAVHENNIFVSHRGTITSVDLDTGSKNDIITDLPSLGDHFNENIAVGPDGKIYFTQGVATNTGVVGIDNYFFGWLPMAPDFHDIPCRDLTLNGLSYTTGNPLTPDVSDTATTGPYLPFGTPATQGQVVRGEVKCSGAILRADLDGSNLEVYADGFRNPYGLAFHPDGRLFVTENGPDDRGSRPVVGPDNFYEVLEDGWYGWPDFYGGLPVNDPERKPHTTDVQEPVLSDAPPLAGEPVAELDEHSASNGFDFSRNGAFAEEGQAFIAQFGDLTPVTSGNIVVEQNGQKVVIVTEEGEVQDFLTGAPGIEGRPVLRPTDAKFSPEGDVLYVAHFGDVHALPGAVVPSLATGALIRISRP